MSNVTFGGGPYVEGQNYTGSDGREYQFKAGCMVMCAPVDIDTVDGYSLPGVAPDGVIDATSGEPIEVGAPVTVFFDENNEIIGYKDCTDDNDFSVLLTATEAFTDDAGNDVAIGDQFQLLADGSTVCAEKTIDTRGTLTPTVESGVSDYEGFDNTGAPVGPCPVSHAIPVDKAGTALAKGRRFQPIDVLTLAEFLAAPNPALADKTIGFNAEGVCGLFDATQITRAVVSPNGQTITITDGITAEVCTIPKIEQDQVLAGWEAVPDGDPNDGVTSWHWNWIIHDIDGNVVNTIEGPTIDVPEFVTKGGQPLAGPITPLLASDFVSGAYADGDLTMVLGADGSCKLAPANQNYTWEQVVDADGNVTYPADHPNQALAGTTVASNSPPGSTVTSYTDASGVYVASHCHPAEYIGEKIKDELADGTPCEGVVTDVIYDGLTCLPVRKYSQCAKQECATLTTLMDFSPITGSTGPIVAPEFWDALVAGDPILFNASLNFTMKKAGKASFIGAWGFDIRNIAIRTTFQMRIDGGNWINPTGGGDPISGGPLAQSGHYEFDCRNYAKGDHTIEFRMVFSDINPAAMTGVGGVPFFQRTISDFYIHWVDNECQEVAV